MKTTSSLVLSALLIISGSALASGVSVKGAVVLERGIFVEVQKGKAAAPNLFAGHYKVVAKPKLVKSTDVVVAKLGTTFGFTYRVDGEPANAVIPITIRTIHPEFAEPESGKVHKVVDYAAKAAIGGPNYDGYTFDKDWQMVPGKWTFQILHKGRVLVEQSFMVK